MERVIFLLAADGPSDYESFRPNLDTQWWGRRDALVRCTNQALYSWDGIASSSFILFSNDLSVLSMKQKIREAITLPNEKNLITEWRTCAAGAAATKEGMQFHRSLWKNSSVERAIEKKDAKLSSAEIASLDKKQLLTILHQICPLEFLQTHKLNSSIPSLLKKTTLPKLQEIYNLIHSSPSPSSDSTSPTPDSPSPSSSPSSLSKLSLVLESILRTESVTRVLVLHENAPQELPVFGDTLPLDPSLKFTPKVTLCFLGAVRDLSSDEELAMLQTCQRLSLPCVVSNLGRTAEFTSKVVSALAAHVKAGKLFQSVCALQRTQKSVDAHEFFSKLRSIRDVEAIEEEIKEGEKTDEMRKKGEKSKRSPPKEERVTHSQNVSTISLVLSLRKYTIEEFRRLIEEHMSGKAEHSIVHSLITVVVNALWRSRINSDFGKTRKVKRQRLGDDKEREGGVDREEKAESRDILQSILVFVFENQVVKLSQRKFLLTLLQKNSSAPSEKQILESLLKLLFVTGSQESVKELLRTEMEYEMSKGYPFLYIHSKKNGDEKFDSMGIMEAMNGVYGRKCACSAVESGKERERNVSAMLMTCLDEYDMDDEEIFGTAKMLKFKRFEDLEVLNLKGTLNHMRTSALVIWLQHIGYHGLSVL